MRAATLNLRALEPKDCGALRSWITSADALLQWSGPWDFRWPLELGQLQLDLERAGDHRRLYAAVDRDGEFVGHAMLTIQPDHRLGVIGRVLIDPARRGGGLGIALMEEVAAVAFDQFGLHRLQLGVYEFNAGAIACYQRVGFVIEGRLRDSTRGSTGYWNGYVMALLKPEYRARRAPESGGLTVRPARLADAPALAHLLTELGYPQDAEQARAQLAAWAGDPRGTVLVAESDGSPAGVAAAHAVPYLERPGSFARVVALAVDRARRRSGVGRQLLAAVEAWALSLGCRDIEITSSRTRDDAHAFYDSLGFVDLCDRSARFKRPLSARSANDSPVRRHEY
jgi:RimJ/RimL family protein N-acetyltransferase